VGATILLVFFAVTTLTKAQDPLGNDISGDEQVGVVTHRLQKPIVVRILDDQGRPLQGTQVTFTILEEPKENMITGKFAALDREIVTADRDGYAMTELTFGRTQGNYYVLAEAHGENLIFKEIALQENWLLFLIFSLFGGLAVFIFGLNYGSKGLVRAAGAKMRDILFSLTKHRFMALLVGVFVTVILGSSTASSILLVRFASSGIIMLAQALGVLLGINIGTTITVQIIAFRILDYAILIVGIGFFMMHFVPRLRNMGQAVFGLGLLFFSLRLMSIATVNLRLLPAFNSAIAGIAAYPVLGIIIAALLAFILRSSAATIGIVLILAFDSMITFPQAIPFIMGANLGTTFSSCLSANTVDGRRVAFGHFLFNTIAIIILFPFIHFIPAVIHIIGGDVARQIANFHTLFNIFTAVVFLPLIYPFASFLKSVVRESKKEMLRMHRLDPAFLSAPAIALGQAAREILYMADITITMLEESIKVFQHKDNDLRKKIIEMDDTVDSLEETITLYLTKISEGEMESRLSSFHSALLGAVNEIEHIGDVISKNLMAYAKKQISAGFVFSKEGFTQIEKLHQFALATFRISVDALTTRDKKLAKDAAARKEVGHKMAKALNELHLDRLRRGLKESLETSTIHVDLVSDLERINFHAAEIGEALL
jgi:phosphate:Na+ symporter